MIAGSRYEGLTPTTHASISIPPAVIMATVMVMAMVTTGMHVNGNSGLLDKTIGLYGTRKAGGQRRGVKSAR